MNELSTAAVRARSTPNGTTKAPLSAWLGFVAMLAVYVYAVVDRQIFVLFADQIRRTMGLSDTQLGLLQGLGLALVGVLTTYPIAWLADRFDRRVVTAACVLTWSLAVVLCGLAPNFWWLFVGASLVGVAEAGIGPAIYAMTGELFPKAMRQTANSIFAIAGRLGAAVGVVLAGAMIFVALHLRPFLPSTLAALSDWRLAFLAAALFAPAGVLLMLTLPRQVAGAAGRAPMATPAPSELLSQSLLRYLRRHIGLQLGVFVGSLLQAFGMACVAAWIPIIAARYYHQTPAEGGAWLGAIAFGTGILGFVLGAVVFRVLRGRLGVALPMLALAACMAIAAGFSLLIGLATSAPILYGVFALQLLLGMITNMVTPTLMQNMVPVHLRARMFAVNGLGTMVAAALSPPLVGVISDRLTGFEHPLQAAVMTTSSVALVLSAVVFFASTKSYTLLVGEVDMTEAF